MTDPAEGGSVAYIVHQAMLSSPNGREVALIEKAEEYLLWVIAELFKQRELARKNLVKDFD